MTNRCACLPYCTCGWLRSRLLSRSVDEQRAIQATRSSPLRLIATLVRYAERNGRRWIVGRAA